LAPGEHHTGRADPTLKKKKKLEMKKINLTNKKKEKEKHVPGEGCGAFEQLILRRPWQSSGASKNGRQTMQCCHGVDL
jgi:hypothetical protein